MSKNWQSQQNSKKNSIFIYFLFCRILITLSIFLFFMISQLILPVLLTPTKYCFHNQVITDPDRLVKVYKTFTNMILCTVILLCDNSCFPQSYSAVHKNMVYTKLSSNPNREFFGVEFFLKPNIRLNTNFMNTKFI